LLNISVNLNPEVWSPNGHDNALASIVPYFANFGSVTAGFVKKVNLFIVFISRRSCFYNIGVKTADFEMLESQLFLISAK
jgi:hypothetical protein